jgi:hypothetical protein
MPSFEKEFRETLGQPIRWNDIELIRIGRISVAKNFSGRLRIVSTNSTWRQGIRMKVNGSITVFVNEKAITGKKFVVWADDLKDDELRFIGTRKSAQDLLVWNVWDQNRGVTDAWLNGAAMILEIDGNIRRYRCNDGHPDENFDDIIFEVIIDEETE